MKKIEEALLDAFVQIDEQNYMIERKDNYINELIEERTNAFKKNLDREKRDTDELVRLSKAMEETKSKLEASRNLTHKQQARLEVIESEESYIQDLEEQITTLRTANDNLKVVKAEQDKVNKKLQTEIFNHKIGYENNIQTIEAKDKIMEDQREIIKELQKDIKRLERESK